MKEADEGGGNFPLDKRKDDASKENGKEINEKTYEKKEFKKYYYEDGVKIDAFKVVIQKKRQESSNRATNSISVLKVGDILYRRMKVGESVQEIKKIGRNRIVVHCRNKEVANQLVDNAELKALHEVFIPLSFVSRAAVVRNIDVEYGEEELKEEIESGHYKILEVSRMKRRMFDNGTMTFGDSQSVKIFFQGTEFPNNVYLWGVRLQCEPFIQPIIQCYQCLRYNHTTKQCKGVRVCKVCGSKDADHECKASATCINCKGVHQADSKECPEKKRQKSIKEMMAFQNLTYMEAAAKVPRPNERDMFSVVTSNMFQALDSYEEYPEIGNNARSRSTLETKTFEPYRPTAQARRRIGLEIRKNNQALGSNSKRRRNTPSSSPIKMQQEKKLCFNGRPN